MRRPNSHQAGTGVLCVLVAVILTCTNIFVSVGGVSVSLLMTPAVCVAATLMLLSVQRPGSTRRFRTALGQAPPKSLVLFLVWAVAISLLRADKAIRYGAQNILCYALFAIGIYLGSAYGSRARVERFGRLVACMGWIPAVIFAVSRIFGVTIGEPRAFAIQAALIISVIAPFRRRIRGALPLTVLLFVEVIISGSRTAMAATAVLLSIVALRGRRRIRAVGAAALLLGTGSGLLYGVEHVAFLRRRFFFGSTSNIFGVSINTEGRSFIWGRLIANWETSPWLGHGAGTATAFVRSFGFPGIGEPHNDYLRLLHDFGYIGLILWLVSYLLLIGRAFEFMRASIDPIHVSALGALIVVALIAVTDNVLIYYFSVFPLGVIVGLSAAVAAGAGGSSEASPDTLKLGRLQY